jgi:hypothetical protein
MRNQLLERLFPGLRGTNYEITSPSTANYNCIAWAANDVSKMWWPGVYYWPDGMPPEDSTEAFVRTFCDCFGYERCERGDLEIEYEKLAIYADGGRTKHMARQLIDGRWTSKLGSERDISHVLSGLEGADYGNVVQFLRRKIAAPGPLLGLGAFAT